MSSDLPIVTRSKLISNLRSLGLTTSDTVMIHLSVKATGWIVGGPDVKLCEVQGKVLLLGAPLTTLTILHHAEHNIPKGPLAEDPPQLPNH